MIVADAAITEVDRRRRSGFPRSDQLGLLPEGERLPAGRANEVPGAFALVVLLGECGMRARLVTPFLSEKGRFLPLHSPLVRMV